MIIVSPRILWRFAGLGVGPLLVTYLIVDDLSFRNRHIRYELLVELQMPEGAVRVCGHSNDPRTAFAILPLVSAGSPAR
jgi:hypothetical protein